VVKKLLAALLVGAVGLCVPACSEEPSGTAGSETKPKPVKEVGSETKGSETKPKTSEKAGSETKGSDTKPTTAGKAGSDSR
jgi:hypothetical protein